MVLRLTHINSLALAAVVLLVVGGCMREPPRVQMISVDADAAGQEAMNMYDTNKDGKISGAELDKAPSLKEGLTGFITTKEKGITAAMIAERVKRWQNDYKVGIMGGVSCKVNLGGKPLANAEVKFVPEKFMGANVPESTGKTGPDGVATISVPTTSAEDASGVPPGWYKVEIKAAEGIPAKYNTQTTLGIEIAPDVRGNPIVFDLKK
jgi:hypothetical protein